MTILSFCTQSPDARSETEKCLEIAGNSRESVCYTQSCQHMLKRISAFKLVNDKYIFKDTEWDKIEL